MNGVYLAAASLLLTGCALTGTPDAGAAKAAVHADKPTEQALALGAEMLAGLQQADYAKFTGNFSTELREAVTEPAFEKLCADLGGDRDRIESWWLLDTLDRGGVYRTEVWKVAVKRTSPNKTAIIDRLFFVTVAAIDGKDAVIGFKFDSLL